MALSHILLGLLSKPATGYELKKTFDEALAHFWDAEQSQIYTTLARLQTEGLLTCKTVPSEKGPNRKLYTRTAKGRKELLKWLAGGPDIGDFRLPYLSQVFFLHEFDDPKDALNFLRQLREHFRAWFEALSAIDLEFREEFPDYPDVIPGEYLYPAITLRFGLKRIQATLDWMDESIATTQRSTGMKDIAHSGDSEKEATK